MLGDIHMHQLFWHGDLNNLSLCLYVHTPLGKMYFIPVTTNIIKNYGIVQ